MWMEIEKYLNEDYKARMDKMDSLKESIENHQDQLECCKNVSHDLLNKFPVNIQEKLTSKIHCVITSKLEELKFQLENEVDQLKSICDLKPDSTFSDEFKHRFYQVRAILETQKVKLQCLLKSPDFYGQMDKIVIAIPDLEMHKMKQLMLMI